MEHALCISLLIVDTVHVDIKKSDHEFQINSYEDWYCGQVVYCTTKLGRSAAENQLFPPLVFYLTMKKIVHLAPDMSGIFCDFGLVTDKGY